MSCYFEGEGERKTEIFSLFIVSRETKETHQMYDPPNLFGASLLTVSQQPALQTSKPAPLQVDPETSENLPPQFYLHKAPTYRLHLVRT